MNSTYLKVISGIFSLMTLGSAFCIGPTFDVYIDNQLVGNIYNQSLNVTFDRFGGPATHEIEADQTLRIPSIDIIKDGSSITFKGTEDWRGYWIRKGQVPKSFLVEKWKELGQPGQLTITVTATGSKMSYELVFTYSTEAPKNFVPVQDLPPKNIDNPFTNFPAIVQNRLQDVISVDKFLAIKPYDWKTPIVSAGYLYGSKTTAADFSRAILGLPEKYNDISIISAKDLLLSHWRVGQETFKKAQLMNYMRHIILHAKDILESQLRDTAPKGASPESGWVIVPNQQPSPEQDYSVSSTSTQQRGSEDSV